MDAFLAMPNGQVACSVCWWHMQDGEIQVIATSMKRYIHEQPLQEACCRTLWNYAQVPCNAHFLCIEGGF